MPLRARQRRRGLASTAQKTKRPSGTRRLAVTVNGRSLWAGVDEQKNKRALEDKTVGGDGELTIKKVAVACQAAALWAGVDGQKNKRAVRDKTAGGDGERKIKNRRCVFLCLLFLCSFFVRSCSVRVLCRLCFLFLVCSVLLLFFVILARKRRGKGKEKRRHERDRKKAAKLHRPKSDG